MAEEFQNIKGLSQMIAALESLPASIVSTNGGVIRKALRKGAIVMVKQAKINVQAIIDADAFNPGRDHLISTGALVKAIGTVRDRDPKAHGFNETYVVKVRRGPRVRNKTPAQYGRMLEFGTEKDTAKPWMTPAYFSKRQEALDTVVAAVDKGVTEAIRKAAALGNWAL
jgi:HK97 gp10 family phage protein